MKKLLPIAVLFCLASLSLFAAPKFIYLPVGDEIFNLEIAATPEALEKGLMNRTYLPEGQGMLFLLREPTVTSFWMKNTLIPLDIIFIDISGRITACHTMNVEPPKKNEQSETQYNASLNRYSSNEAAAAAIELNEGTISFLGLKPGDRLPWKPADVLKRCVQEKQ